MTVWNLIVFNNKPIYTDVLTLGEDLLTNMLIMYYPDPDKYGMYRKTIWAGKIITESVKPMNKFAQKIYPGKIYPVTDIEKIHACFKDCGIFFQGRYGKWIPKYYIHDVYETVMKEIGFE